MPDETRDAAASEQRARVKNRQRDPHDFAGTPDADVHDWLKTYDRVSEHNRWDDTVKLANVVFYLKGTALQWFDNHEEEINSWDGFKAAFADVFGTPERRRQQARDKLSHRYQAPTESSTSYIEDVLRLCGRVDSNMPEDDKIRHLFKGLSQELFSVVAPKSPPTVQQLISECKHYEELQSARILKAPFARLPEVSSPTSATDLPALIRAIIREELRDFLSSLPGSKPSVDSFVQSGEAPAPSIQQIIKDELRSALHREPSIPCTYASAAVSSPAVCALQHVPQLYAPMQRQDMIQTAPRPYAQPRRTEVWRTTDRRPVCFYCHKPGHVIRYCHRRIAAETYGRPPANNPGYANDDDATRNIDDRPLRFSSDFQPRRGRSSSPYPRRQRSVSPFNNTSVVNQPSN